VSQTPSIDEIGHACHHRPRGEMAALVNATKTGHGAL
jgi:hypothetical protein